MNGRALLTYKEAAEELRCSVDTVKRRADEGLLKRKWLSPNNPRITTESVEHFIKNLPEERPSKTKA